MWLSTLPCTFIAKRSMAKCRPGATVDQSAPIISWLQGSGLSREATVSIGAASETVLP